MATTIIVFIMPFFLDTTVTGTDIEVGGKTKLDDTLIVALDATGIRRAFAKACNSEHCRLILIRMAELIPHSWDICDALEVSSKLKIGALKMNTALIPSPSYGNSIFLPSLHTKQTT
eukprot:15331233-Ditylum_brightwellii.AAC.1